MFDLYCLSILKLDLESIFDGLVHSAQSGDSGLARPGRPGTRNRWSLDLFTVLQACLGAFTACVASPFRPFRRKHRPNRLGRSLSCSARFAYQAMPGIGKDASSAGSPAPEHVVPVRRAAAASAASAAMVRDRLGLGGPGRPSPGRHWPALAGTGRPPALTVDVG